MKKNHFLKLSEDRIMETHGEEVRVRAKKAECGSLPTMPTR